MNKFRCPTENVTQEKSGTEVRSSSRLPSLVEATDKALEAPTSSVRVKEEPTDEPEEIIPNTQTIIFPTGQIPSSPNTPEQEPEPDASETVTAVVPAKPAELFQICIICQEPVACKSMSSAKYQEHVDNCCEKNARIEFHEELFSNNNDIIGTDSQMVRRSSRRSKTQPVKDEKISEKVRMIQILLYPSLGKRQRSVCVG